MNGILLMKYYYNWGDITLDFPFWMTFFNILPSCLIAASYFAYIDAELYVQSDVDLYSWHILIFPSLLAWFSKYSYSMWSPYNLFAIQIFSIWNYNKNIAFFRAEKKQFSFSFRVKCYRHKTLFFVFVILNGGSTVHPANPFPYDTSSAANFP